MDRQKTGSKGFLKVAVTVAVVMMFIIPVSSTFESENIFVDTIIRIHPDIQIVKKGETFNASIEVVPSPGKTIISVDVGVLSFDPTLLQANSVTEGNLFISYKTFTPGIINNTAGTITGIAGNATPPHATIYPGFFCIISFTAQDEIGTSFLDIDDVVVANTTGGSIPITVNNGSVTITAWSMMLNFSETSGKNDYVIFGEIHDANDGEPPDIYYDVPKAPAPVSPYIRGWFDAGMSEVYSELSEDYRHYPDTYKIWDLYVQWESGSSNPTNIMISWNNNEFNNCEYSNITLMRYDPFDVEWDFVANMLTENEYMYMPRYFAPTWLKDHFQIITSDPIPPVISDLILIPSDPIDINGWENFTCSVTDNVVVNQVDLVVTDPNAIIVEYPMINIPSTNIYYYNTTFMQPGNYNYHIWATDLSGNNVTSASDTFPLPANEDVDMNGQVHFSDLMDVIRIYGVHGPDGWVREDVDNNGQVHFSDLMDIIRHYGEEWWK